MVVALLVSVFVATPNICDTELEFVAAVGYAVADAVDKAVEFVVF